MTRLFRDPRVYQIAILAGLLAYGMAFLDFEIAPPRAVLVIAGVLLAQYACTRLWRLDRFDARSPLISGLSLCLLMRTNSATLALLTIAITILSKFAIRVGGKHVFNPTNLGLTSMMLLSGQIWVSPGQWGNAVIFALFMACLGGLVVTKATRADISLAFLAVYAGLVVGRSAWLGEPLAIPLHRLESGALLLFAFFMISDPKTTPDSRPGRLAFAALVAAAAWYIQFRLFRTNGPLWALAGSSPLVPLIDRWLPAGRYAWTEPRRRSTIQEGTKMKRVIFAAAIAGLVVCLNHPVKAFCGFYVCKADTKLFNRASQVVLVRDRDRTVLTMANDFSGNPTEFAVVIPVPTRIERDQIHVGDKALIDHLDAYSAPRLVEYFDQDPCDLRRMEFFASRLPASAAKDNELDRRSRERSLGVTVEAQYTVGEYDIVLLSATQSSGLETWLRENGYRIPTGASAVLGSYIKQTMRFFVAKVNLKEHARLGFSYLRPLQVAYESPKFMLPIRLGMVNADGPQELFVYALTRRGRVETTNYRMVKLATGMELPGFVKQEFPSFYKAMFSEQVRREDMRAVFVEYAWDMQWCDPCAADPLSRDELRQLGVFWLDEGSPAAVGRFRGLGGGAQDAFVTRLHVRYDNAHFPEDLVFQETADRENFQARYVLRHPWTGGATCDAARQYRQELGVRQEREAQALATLTGWSVAEIRSKSGMTAAAAPVAPAPTWWQRLWK